MVPRLFCALSILLTIATVASGADSLQWSGFALLRGSSTSGPPSSRNGGTGRFDEGDGPALSSQAQLGIDWTPSLFVNAHLHLLAHEDHIGVPEMYVDATLRPRGDRVRIRAGAFFLPGSRENVDELWETPYTITPSALNSWLGEEFRPIGVDVDWSHRGFGAGATLYRGNDAFGAVPVAYGWTWSDRWTALGEDIPAFLPGTEELISSVSEEVDGRVGWAARARWIGENVVLQLTRIDNRADGLQYGKLLTWDTQFNIVAAEYSNERWTIASEYGWGPDAIPEFILDLETGYILVSRRFSRARASLRFETFDNTSNFGDDDRGSAMTAALFWEPRGPLRVGVEVIAVDTKRAGIPESANRVAVELRYRFSKR